MVVDKARVGLCLSPSNVAGMLIQECILLG